MTVPGASERPVVHAHEPPAAALRGEHVRNLVIGVRLVQHRVLPPAGRRLGSQRERVRGARATWRTTVCGSSGPSSSADMGSGNAVYRACTAASAPNAARKAAKSRPGQAGSLGAGAAAGEASARP